MQISPTYQQHHNHRHYTYLPYSASRQGPRARPVGQNATAAAIAGTLEATCGCPNGAVCGAHLGVFLDVLAASMGLDGSGSHGDRYGGHPTEIVEAREPVMAPIQPGLIEDVASIALPPPRVRTPPVANEPATLESIRAEMRAMTDQQDEL
ncbi:hypothetical protein L1987_48707 [Smallanthus sonchifolius]|uniref:Uncharacterized protein n=1 Tax=Smallanthus sonchifolius TaxID=185202 RepID=A0ACB9FTC1_9ASTR|nr:hypothetical protein L1987_48707 [Smallanthus sonchifolius]